MKTVISVGLLLGLASLASTHLCLVSPHQRGNLTGLNTIASADCYRLSAPCGGFDQQGDASDVFEEQATISIRYQKNADHWLAATPGYFAISLIEKTHGQAMTHELKRRQDMGEPSLTMYSDNISLPIGIHGDAVIQVTYVTNNPAAPSHFYQCADVTIHSRGGGVVG